MFLCDELLLCMFAFVHSWINKVSLEVQACVCAVGKSLCRSLDIAVVVCPVGFAHVHTAHRQPHAVDSIAPRWHPFIDAVQTFGLLKTADPMLRGEASDGCRNTHTCKVSV